MRPSTSTSIRSVPPSASVNLRSVDSFGSAERSSFRDPALGHSEPFRQFDLIHAEFASELAKLMRDEFSFDRLLVLADLLRRVRIFVQTGQQGS